MVKQWKSEIVGALEADRSQLRIVSPFIKTNALDQLLSLQPSRIQVIIRFKLADFAKEVGDVGARSSPACRRRG